MSTFTITSSARGLTHTADSYNDAQHAARMLAEAEAGYLAGTPHWHSVMVVERVHNADGNCTGYRVLRRPTGPLAAHITPTEVVAAADIAADFRAIQAEREAGARRTQVEQVRQWMAEGIEVPAHYPVQPSDLIERDLAEEARACAGSVAYSLTRKQIRVFWCDVADVEQDARLYPRTDKGHAAAERCIARKVAEGYRNIGQWERGDTLGQLAQIVRASAPLTGLPAGARVEIIFGHDTGNTGTVKSGPDASGYYVVRVDGREPGEPGDEWWYLGSELRLSTTPPPTDQPWANDSAYAAEGARIG